MSEKDVTEDFEKLWKDIEKPSLIGNIIFDFSEKQAISMMKKRMDHNAKVIDVGCGTGRTLEVIRKYGFSNSIGVDSSETSIKLCKSRGFEPNKDVFIVDILKNEYKNNEFDLVFAEGLLEHFEDFSEIVKQFCRMSKKYVLIIQPNHFSFYYKWIRNFYYKFFPENTVKELTYSKEEFNKPFSENGFELKESHNTILHAFWILLYEKVNK